MRWTVAENVNEIKYAARKKWVGEILCLTYETYLLGTDYKLNVIYVRDELGIDDIILRSLNEINSDPTFINSNILIEAHRFFLMRLLYHLDVAEQVSKKLSSLKDMSKYTLLLDKHSIDGLYRTFNINNFNKVNSSNALKRSLLKRSTQRNKNKYFLISTLMIFFGFFKLSLILLYEMLTIRSFRVKKKYKHIIFGWGRDLSRFYNSDSELINNSKLKDSINVITRPKKLKKQEFFGDKAIIKETFFNGESYGISFGYLGPLKRFNIFFRYVVESKELIKFSIKKKSQRLDIFLYFIYYHKQLVTEIEIFKKLISEKTESIIISDSQLPSVRYSFLNSSEKKLKIYSTVHGSTFYDYFGNWYLSKNRISTDICFMNKNTSNDTFIKQKNKIENYVDNSNCIMIATRSNEYAWFYPTFNQVSFYNSCEEIIKLLPNCKFIIKSHPSSDAYYLYNRLAENNKNVEHNNKKFDQSNYKSITAVLSIGDPPSLFYEAILQRIPVFFLDTAQNHYQKKYSFGFENNFLEKNIKTLVSELKVICLSNKSRDDIANKQFNRCQNL
ncbi:hypothetical protein N9C88_03575 [Candidatus Pseudothioglobus singularis]|nr:hypothetical protein [Candidatus Pseudothioglobus singularis]